MKRGVIVLAALALTACTLPNSAEPGADQTLDGGGVAKVAEAPDGTILWGVWSRGRMVYFSSAGAAWKEGCGKNCSRDVQVPNAVPLAR